MEACGILAIGKATVNISKKNTVTGNDANILGEDGAVLTGTHSA